MKKKYKIMIVIAAVLVLLIGGNFALKHHLMKITMFDGVEFQFDKVTYDTIIEKFGQPDFQTDYERARLLDYHEVSFCGYQASAEFCVITQGGLSFASAVIPADTEEEAKRIKLDIEKRIRAKYPFFSRFFTKIEGNPSDTMVLENVFCYYTEIKRASDRDPWEWAVEILRE